MKGQRQTEWHTIMQWIPLSPTLHRPPTTNSGVWHKPCNLLRGSLNMHSGRRAPHAQAMPDGPNEKEPVMASTSSGSKGSQSEQEHTREEHMEHLQSKG